MKKANAVPFERGSRERLPRLDDSGQGIIEYALMLLIALTFVAILANSFRRTLITVWGYYTKQISAACPGCPADPAYRFR